MKRIVGMSLVALAAGLCGGCSPGPEQPRPDVEARLVNQTKHQDGKVWIEGVDVYRVTDPVFEAVRIVLGTRGDVYSPAYIQGITGNAFRIGGICPCAPTCAGWMGPPELLRILGYECEPGSLGNAKPEELPAATAESVKRIRTEIDAGRAVVVFHAFTTAEYDVVFGYDSRAGQFLGRGSYKGNDKPYEAADEKRMSTCGSICPAIGAVFIGAKTGKLDARAAEVAALKEAVQHARWKEDPKKLPADKWTMFYGLACFDRWAADWRAAPKGHPGGSQYCYGVFRGRHRAAGDFLHEIAPKYAKGGLLMAQAAERFNKEADVLDSGENLLGWNAPKEPTPDQCAKAADTLQRARDEYAAGIDLIEKALMAEGIAAE